MKITGKELKRNQEKLCQDFIKNPDKIEKLMKIFQYKIKDFHYYSIRNLILANDQLLAKKHKNIELLAPYKRWQKIGRHVKKGEKGLRIIAPVIKKLKDEETGEELQATHVYYRVVTVFDISQTEGERLNPNFIKGNVDFDKLLSQSPYPVTFNDKQVTRGETDFNKIEISKYLSDAEKAATLIHELAHIYCNHENRDISKSEKELEAETISFMLTSALGLKNDKSAQYIKGWYNNNPEEKIKERSKLLLDTSMEIGKVLGVI